MLTKRYALITGGSKGLGFAIAKELARKQYIPILIARAQEGLDDAIMKLKEQGYEAHSFVGDVTKAEELERIANEVSHTFKKIDFFVINAGTVHNKLLMDYDRIDEMKADIDVCLWGAMLSARYFLPILVNGSRVLVVSSGFGLMGPAGYSTYSAAKGGLNNLAESLQRELACRDITVHLTVPADIDTSLFRQEKEMMPEWMGRSASRGKVMSADQAAQKILKKCHGKRFLIVINFEVTFLIFITRFLPRRWRDFILDLMFPRPHLGHYKSKMHQSLTN